MSSRKRKTINIKRVTTRSVGGQGIQKYIAAAGIVDNGEEHDMMENEERLQRQVDNFWGLDKDLKDRLYEINLMGEEDRLNMLQEYMLRLHKQHMKWDQEFVLQQRRREAADREAKVGLRLEHLRLINSPYPVEEVLHTIWNLSDAEPTPLLPNIASLSLNSLYHQPAAEASMQKDLVGGGELEASISSLEAVRMPLHLEGLQRSRDIVDQARSNMKQALKDIHTASKPQKSILSDNASSDKPIPPSVQKTEQAIKDAVKGGTHLPPREEYNSALLGHPRLHWDQQLMLQAAFNLLDKNQRGYLTPEQLGKVASDPAVRDILQFSVLWSVIKHRNWAHFENMLEIHDEGVAANAARMHMHSGASGNGRRASAFRGHPHLAPLSRSASFKSERATHTPAPRIATFQSWMRSAEELTREGRVPIRRIRTQTEHERLTALKGFQHDFWDDEHTGMLRSFRLMRTLQVGDCVWALHRGGVRWLPAVVEHVHHTAPGYNQETVERSSWIFDSADSVPTVASDSAEGAHPYSYDLWFPLSEQDLVDSRLHSTSKQLLTLPSQIASEGLKARPFPDERSACAYAYDLVDAESAGVVELSALVNGMKSSEMRPVVETSAVLVAIFYGPAAGAEMDTMVLAKVLRKKKKSKVKLAKTTMPALLPVFIDTFSTQTENNPEEPADEDLAKHKIATSLDCISKMDFLEFCAEVQNAIKYDLHRLRCK